MLRYLFFKKEGERMAGKDIIMISNKELRKLKIIYKVLEEKMTQVKAGEVLGLTDRQIRRIIKKVREEGEKGIIHKSRGKTSNRKLPKKIKKRVIKIYKEKYKDFGTTLANEKLMEIEKIKIGTQTLRNWLIEEGLWAEKKKHKIHKTMEREKRILWRNDTDGWVSHRDISKHINLDSILSIKTERTIRNDNTIAHNKNLYQIMERINVKRVMVEERIDGSMAITYLNRILKYKEISLESLRKKKEEKIPLVKPRKPYIPPKDHPWRRYPVFKTKTTNHYNQDFQGR